MELFPCPTGGPRYWRKSRCGEARGCIPDDRQDARSFREHVCDALIWNSVNDGGFVEIWTPDNSKRLVKITSRWANPDRVASCGLQGQVYVPPGRYAQSEAFTVDIPGLNDIVKLPGLDNPRARFERMVRAQTARSAIPEFLQWIPPILTMLDNIQDMLFVGLALAIPIIKRLPSRMLPGFGWLLLANDILNLFT